MKKKTRLVVLGIVGIFFIVTFFYGLYSFFTTYGLQSPVILRSPVYKLKAESVITLKDHKRESVVFNVGKIADYIYMKESSSGVNDSCRNLGLYNGYGFRQDNFEWICYPSHEAVRAEVINWLTLHIEKGDIVSALCLYNRGVYETNCTYALNYK